MSIGPNTDRPPPMTNALRTSVRRSAPGPALERNRPGGSLFIPPKPDGSLHAPSLWQQHHSRESSANHGKQSRREHNARCRLEAPHSASRTQARVGPWKLVLPEEYALTRGPLFPHTPDGRTASGADAGGDQLHSFSGYTPCSINLRMSATTRGRSSRYVTPNHEAVERRTRQRA